ncbi:MAG: hypothetical protein ABIU20_09620 [Blastocatellia bacterium]
MAPAMSPPCPSAKPITLCAGAKSLWQRERLGKHSFQADYKGWLGRLQLWRYGCSFDLFQEARWSFQPFLHQLRLCV